MKTKTRIVFLICIMVIAALTGCGGEKEETVSPQTESVDRSEQSVDSEDDTAGTGEDPTNENDAKENTDNKDSSDNEDNADAANSTSNTDSPDGADSLYNPDSATELDGHVQSVSESSAVVSKIFSETVESDEGTVWVMSSGGGDNEVLVTVYFEEDADYVYKTIRNGGRDVDTRKGSFSDIKEGVLLLLNGRYVGEDFYAAHVEIDNVILGDAW